jgi:tetratricopeptide (TPR) repeat protein
MHWRLKFLHNMSLAAVMVSAVTLPGCFAPPSPAPVQRQMRAEELIAQAVLFLRDERLEEAEGAFVLSISLLPSAAATDGLGCVAYRRGDLRQAEQLFLRAIELDREYFAAYSNLGLLYDRVGDVRLARKYFNVAIELQPDDSQTRVNHGVLLASSRDPAFREEAAKEFVRGAVGGSNGIAPENFRRLRASEKER